MQTDKKNDAEIQGKNRSVMGVILSGGAGSRLNGIDKGLQPFNNVRLIEHVINAIRPQINDLIICANRNIKTYESFGYSVVQDKYQARYEGPLAGINSVINWLITNEQFNHIGALLIAPCDAPNLPVDFYSRLCNSKAPVALVHDGKRKQNLHCLISRPHWASLQAFYEQGGRALHHWYSQEGAVEVDFSDKPNCFKNINRQKDFLDNIKKPE